MNVQVKAEASPARSAGRDLLRTLLRAEHLIENGDAAAAAREAGWLLEGDESYAEAYRVLAEAARQTGDAAAAIAHACKGIELQPGNASLHSALGNALQDAGHIESAIEAYERSLRLAPDSGETWNDLGTAHFALGETEAAAQCYRNALQRAPDHGVALSNLGATLRRLGDLRGAIRAYRGELWQRVRGSLRRRRASSAPDPSCASLTHEAERWRLRGNRRAAGGFADWALDIDSASPGPWIVKAEILSSAGDLQGAAELLQRAARAVPGHSVLLARLGSLQWRLAQAVEALRSFRAAGSEAVVGAGVADDFAACLVAHDGKPEALALLQARARAVGDADSWASLGRLRLDLDQQAEAAESLATALDLDPHSAATLAQLGRQRVAQKAVAEALAYCTLAVRCDFTCAEAHFWLGRALALAGRWEEACAAFREALELARSPYTAAAQWLADGLLVLEKAADAEAVLREAHRQRPREPEIWARLVRAIIEQGDLGRARGELAGLVGEFPEHPGALANMCTMANMTGEMDQALHYARKAIAAAPDDASANVNLGLTLLKLQRYDEGWDRYERRRDLESNAGVYARFPFPEWDGSSLRGKTLLVYAEQGLGDEIMFASCLPDARSLARNLVVECDPKLAPLFERSFPGCAIFARERTASNHWVRSVEPQPDVQTPMASLAARLRRRASDFPRHEGYLRPDPQKVANWRERLARLAPGPKLGLSWRGGVARTGRALRSLELAQLAPLLERANATFVSLQYGRVADELATFEKAHPGQLVHWQEAIDDYDQTAALLCALDGVVTVCTAIVHLSGALGRRTLVMAPYSPEWRYGIAGEGMPWYPSVRILRQARLGDWSGVMAGVRAAFEGGWAGA